MPDKPEKVLLKMTVSGKPVEVRVDPTWTLLKVLREALKLTGTKKGCEQVITAHPAGFMDYSLGGRCCRDLMP